MFSWFIQLRAFADNRDDLSLGHVVVLLQYDWPQGEMLFLKALDKICQQGSFQYENFFNYVTSILFCNQLDKHDTVETDKVVFTGTNDKPSCVVMSRMFP